MHLVMEMQMRNQFASKVFINFQINLHQIFIIFVSVNEILRLITYTYFRRGSGRWRRRHIRLGRRWWWWRGIIVLQATNSILLAYQFYIHPVLRFHVTDIACLLALEMYPQCIIQRVISHEEKYLTHNITIEMELHSNHIYNKENRWLHT